MGVKGMCTKCWEEMIPELDEMLLGTTESLRRPDADRILDYQLKKYGLSLIEYKAMFESQTGRCAICKSAPTLKRLSVDHDHKTGAVRGLLCTNCNLGLGNFKDDQEILKAASDYLSGYFKPLD